MKSTTHEIYHHFYVKTIPSNIIQTLCTSTINPKLVKYEINKKPHIYNFLTNKHHHIKSPLIIECLINKKYETKKNNKYSTLI
jgi:hypothetical protein